MENEMFEFIAPCHFGMEAVLKREIQNIGYQITEVEDGRVTFSGDAGAVARSNIFLRTTERVMLKCGSFKAETFDELYDGIRDIPWERFLPRNARFWVTKATTNKSKLFAATSIQAIAKKAMVERMSQTYFVKRFSEDGADYPVRIFIKKDIVTVGIDTSGVSLHKRGYRTFVGKAPISETLAAALLLNTPWKSDRPFIDPFCGSGTFPIEAAMIGANIAPGINREFVSEKWTKIISEKKWNEAREEAKSQVIEDVPGMFLRGSDIDAEIVRCARANAEAAGVGKYIQFENKDVRDVSSQKEYGFIVTNPPYGERLEDNADLPELYSAIGESFSKLDKWSMFIITSYEDAEKYIGRKADKNRKIYNGMIKAYFYQFMGPKPVKGR